MNGSMQLILMVDLENGYGMSHLEHQIYMINSLNIPKYKRWTNQSSIVKILKLVIDVKTI